MRVKDRLATPVVAASKGTTPNSSCSSGAPEPGSHQSSYAEPLPSEHSEGHMGVLVLVRSREGLKTIHSNNAS